MCEPALAGDFIEGNSPLPLNPNPSLLNSGDMSHHFGFWIHSLNLKSKIAILKLSESLLKRYPKAASCAFTYLTLDFDIAPVF